MPIIMIDSKQNLDGSLKKKAFTFLEKLGESDASPGLHIEPIANSVDSRVRTGRVDQQFRAVLFRLEQSGNPVYVYYGIWNHDEAIEVARRSVIQANRYGIAEVLQVVSPVQPGESVDPVSVSSALSLVPALGYLQAIGYGMSELVEDLGINPVIAANALAAVDEAALLEISQSAPAWQADALLELAVGTSISDIRGKLQLETSDAVSTEDVTIISAMSHPASRMEFTLVDDDAELRRILESGNFDAWRHFLHPEQRKYVEGRTSGAFRLSGGAGTGKTVVLVHRARRLAMQDPSTRVVLCTFNTVLAAALARDLTNLDPSVTQVRSLGVNGVLIAGLDALALSVVAEAGEDLAAATDSILGTGHVEHTQRADDTTWNVALRSSGGLLDNRLRRLAFLNSEYVEVVLANKITTAVEYVRAARVGRGVRLSRVQRVQLWTVFEAYRRINRINGAMSYPELVSVAAEVLRRRSDRTGDYFADHVLVDEAQDFHGPHWNLLRALVPEGPDDLFIAEDSHQRIYGQPVILSKFGIKIVGRARRLTLNYRTTAQNLQFALRLLEGQPVMDLEACEESVKGYRSSRSGPDPIRSGFTSVSEELDAVASQLALWIGSGVRPETIAILTRTRPQRDMLVRALRERGHSVIAVDKDQPDAVASRVLTMHRAKGMEFSSVILWGLDDKNLPLSTITNELEPEDRNEAILLERALLYVAATRARDRLMVSWAGRPSELLRGPGSD